MTEVEGEEKSKEGLMKAILRIRSLGALAIVVLGLASASAASAQCALPGWNKMGAIRPQSWRSTGELSSGRVVLASAVEGPGARIVGFWKVKFVSKGTPGIPDDAVIDNGFAQWHADGTEIMNSSRVPATGNFCMGVFEMSGPGSYDLNHFGLSFDPAGNFIGPARIREHVTLNQAADEYEGTFTIDQYDATGNPIVHIQGDVTGKRITVATPVADVL
jgi:hypothetical protein